MDIVSLVMLTHKAREKNMKAALAEIYTLEDVKDEAQLIRIEEEVDFLSCSNIHNVGTRRLTCPTLAFDCHGRGNLKLVSNRELKGGIEYEGRRKKYLSVRYERLSR